MLGVLVMLFRLQSDLLSYLWRALIASLELFNTYPQTAARRHEGGSAFVRCFVATPTGLGYLYTMVLRFRRAAEIHFGFTGNSESPQLHSHKGHPEVL